MQIKTLAQILAESDSDSASSAGDKSKSPSKTTSKPAKLTQSELFNRRKSKKAQRLDKASTKDSFAKNTSDTLFEEKTNNASLDDSEDSLFANDCSDANQTSKPKATKRKKRKKRFHAAAPFIAEPNDAPAYVPPDSQTIQQMLAEVKREVHTDKLLNRADPINGKDNSGHSGIRQTTTNATLIASDNNPTQAIAALSASEMDNLPSALKAYLRTPAQKQAEIDAIKAESRLRWLAFYYLSRREYGKAELKQKLIDKEQDPDSIDKLLAEFEEKGYQSDYRTTLMLIRENIRKGRGRQRIKQEFYKKKIAMPSNIDELIDMANAESEEFREFVAEADSLVEGVDWLKLAVEARTKKYGDDIPVEQKDKAKQLRFLQYRGFQMDVCFEALNYTLETLEERF